MSTRPSSEETGVDDRLESRLAAGLLGFACLVPFLLAFLTGRALYYRDHALYFRPAWWSIHAQLSNGQLPILNLAHPSGIVHEVSTNQALFTPMTLLLFLGPFERSYDLFVLAHIPLLAAGMFLLLRRFGLSPLAAIAGGMTVSLAGPVLAFENLLVGLQGLAYTPWLLWAIKRSVDEPTWSSAGPVALSFAFAAQAIMPEVLLLDLLGTSFILLGRESKTLSPRLVLVLGLGAMLGLVAALVDLVPLFEALKGTSRLSGFDQELRGFWSLTSLQWMEFFVPAFWSTPEVSSINIPAASGSTHGPQYLTTLYLGVALPVALASVGLERRRLVLAAASALFLIVAMGNSTPIHGWLSSLPLLKSTRFPVKYVLLLVPGLAIFVALSVRNAPQILDRLLLWVFAHLALLGVFVALIHSEFITQWHGQEARPYSDGVPGTWRPFCWST